MPTYDYLCQSCGHKQEAFQKITEAALKTCDQCHKDTLVRKPSGGIALAFTGDGFYSTMYGKDKDKDKQPKETDSGGSGGCCPCGKNKSGCDNP